MVWKAYARGIKAGHDGLAVNCSCERSNSSDIQASIYFPSSLSQFFCWNTWACELGNSGKLFVRYAFEIGHDSSLVASIPEKWVVLKALKKEAPRLGKRGFGGGGVAIETAGRVRLFLSN